MFNLNNYPDLLKFLKSNSNIYRSVGTREIMIHCPYCDDSTRKNASRHGHLYLSINYPVFHCFRCDTSGILPQLLIDFGFDNDDILNEIKKHISYKYKKDHYQKLSSPKKFIKSIHETNTIFKEKHSKEFYDIKNYVNKRLGEFINFEKFNIVPDIVNNKTAISFLNYNGEKTVSRFIYEGTRYKKHSNEMYFFQPWNFEKYSSVVIAEGPFDIINLYLYNNEFKNSLYASIGGKGYISAVEKLLMTEMIVGTYEINLIFDKDVKNYRYFINKCKQLTYLLNDNVKIFGWTPSISKDTGEIPIIKKIKEN